MIKILRKLKIKGNFLNIIKAINQKPIANNILNGEIGEFFPQHRKKDKDVHYHHFYLTFLLDVQEVEKDKVL